MMSTRTFAFALLSSTLLLSACNKDQPPTVEPESHSNTATDEIGQLNQTPIKTFAATADDAHDIALLEDFDHRFTEMSDSMQSELEKMQHANTLTPEFEQQRQQDNIHSALVMLKDLELKTPQGRYIQGLLYGYWENQAKRLAQATTSPSSQPVDAQQLHDLKQYFHAQSQLQHWRSSHAVKATAQPE